MNWQPSWRQMQGREWGATLVVVLALLLSGCAERKEQAPTSIPAEPILEGKALYEVNCQACHGGETGGQMMDIPPPHNANGHTWHHPDCQLKEIVLQGSGEMAGMMREMMGASRETPRMPAFAGQLSEQEVEAILAYIKTWWTDEQRAAQARVTEANC